MNVTPISLHTPSKAMSFKGNEETKKVSNFIEQHKKPLVAGAALLSCAVIGGLIFKGKLASPSNKALSALNADIRQISGKKAPEVLAFARETETKALGAYEGVMKLIQDEKIAGLKEGDAAVEIAGKLYTRGAAETFAGTDAQPLFEKVKTDNGESILRKIFTTDTGVLIQEMSEGDKVASEYTLALSKKEGAEGGTIANFLKAIFFKEDAADVVQKEGSKFSVAYGVKESQAAGNAICAEQYTFDEAGKIASAQFSKNSNTYTMEFKDGKIQFVEVKNQYTNGSTTYILNEAGILSNSDAFEVRNVK